MNQEKKIVLNQQNSQKLFLFLAVLLFLPFILN